jgi:D-hexose-6-phosphate mutarotase
MPSGSIAGGIPIVFPVFRRAFDTRLSNVGLDKDTVPHHGFARLLVWRVLEEEEQRVVLKLGEDDCANWVDGESRWEVVYTSVC